MNKVLVRLYVPSLEKEYDVWIPINKKIHKIISLLVKSIYELSGGYYNPLKLPMLYEKNTSNMYDINLNVKECNIRNGTELILI